MTDTNRRIDEIVQGNDVVLFMKGTALFPQCGFSWPTIPQLYIKGEFVGGSDIMMEMFEAGELKQLLDDKQVAKAQ
jgi:monothiol glutaredoxin